MKIDNPRHRIGQSKWFWAKFKGPYRVDETIGEQNFKLYGSSVKLRDELENFNRLYKYFEREKRQNDFVPSVEQKLGS